MSNNLLSDRHRAVSHGNLRKRIIRTPSEDRNQSQMKKYSTMTSFRPKIQRLIQEGKIEQILNSDHHSKANIFYNNSVNQIQKQLASTKKSLSTFTTKTKSKENSINRLKFEIKKTQKQIDIIKQQYLLTNKKNGNAGDQLQQKKVEYDLIFWYEKSNQHVKHRLVDDNLVLRARYQRLQRQFDKDSIQYKNLEKKYHELKQLNKELNKMKNKADQITRLQANEKQQFIDLLDNQMQERRQLGDLKADKYKKEAQINNIASSLIEKQELQRTLQILYTHRILAQIIRSKSNLMLEKYESVCRAHNHIRSNSNINDPDKVLKRMEEHDKLYDDALKRANNLESQLKKLEKNIASQHQNRIGLLSKEGQNQELQHGFYQGLQKDKYEILISQKQKQEKKCENDDILIKNIEQWALKMFKLYDIKYSSGQINDGLSDLVVKIKQKMK